MKGKEYVEVAKFQVEAWINEISRLHSLSSAYREALEEVVELTKRCPMTSSERTELIHLTAWLALDRKPEEPVTRATISEVAESLYKAFYDNLPDPIAARKKSWELADHILSNFEVRRKP